IYKIGRHSLPHPCKFKWRALPYIVENRFCSFSKSCYICSGTAIGSKGLIIKKFKITSLELFGVFRTLHNLLYQYFEETDLLEIKVIFDFQEVYQLMKLFFLRRKLA